MMREGGDIGLYTKFYKRVLSLHLETLNKSWLGGTIIIPTIILILLITI